VTKTIFKRVSMTLDHQTIRKCRTLADQQGQSVSSFIRYLVRDAYEKALAAAKSDESRPRVLRSDWREN